MFGKIPHVYFYTQAQVINRTLTIFEEYNSIGSANDVNYLHKHPLFKNTSRSVTPPCLFHRKKILCLQARFHRLLDLAIIPI